MGYLHYFVFRYIVLIDASSKQKVPTTRGRRTEKSNAGYDFQPDAGFIDTHEAQSSKFRAITTHDSIKDRSISLTNLLIFV